MFVNEVTLHGNLTRDPELKSLPSGMMVVSFSVATNRVWKDRDGKKQEDVDYHNVVAFGKTAETIAKYVFKGDAIYIKGRLKTQSWEKDGVKHYRTEIIAENFQFGRGNKKQEARTTQSDGGGSVLPEYPTEEINPEDIPF